MELRSRKEPVDRAQIRVYLWIVEPDGYCLLTKDSSGVHELYDSMDRMTFRAALFPCAKQQVHLILQQAPSMQRALGRRV